MTSGPGAGPADVAEALRQGVAPSAVLAEPQLTGAVPTDLAVPGQPFTLGQLQVAQALGDLRALRARGRPAIRVHLLDRAAGLAQLVATARGLSG